MSGRMRRILLTADTIKTTADRLGGIIIYRADAQDDPDVLASGAVEDVIESKGSEGRKRRLEHRQYNIGAARSLACAAGVLAARDFGQRGDGDTGAKGHNQACVHGKAQGGRKAAREYDQFVE